MKNKRLGRGIAALLDNDFDLIDANEPTQIVRSGSHSVSPDMLIPNEMQPRILFDESKLKELAESIRSHGIIQPILVRNASLEGMYEIIAGERRWRAAQVAGLREVPVVIRNCDDAKCLEIAILENVQREDLNPIEEARGYQNLMKKFGYTHENIADVIGKSRSYVTNAIRLLSLPDAVIDLVKEGRLDACHARLLVNREDAEALAIEAAEKKMSVKELGEIISGAKKIEQNPEHKKFTKDKSIEELESRLSKTFVAKAKINIGNAEKGKGSVAFPFSNYNELDALLKKFGL